MKWNYILFLLISYPSQLKRSTPLIQSEKKCFFSDFEERLKNKIAEGGDITPHSKKYNSTLNYYTSFNSLSIAFTFSIL